MRIRCLHTGRKQRRGPAWVDRECEDRQRPRLLSPALCTELRSTAGRGRRGPSGRQQRWEWPGRASTAWGRLGARELRSRGSLCVAAAPTEVTRVARRLLLGSVLRVLRRTASAEAGSASYSAMAGGSGAREARCRPVSRLGSPGSEVPAASLTGLRAEARPVGGGGGSRRTAQDRCSRGVLSAAWQHPFLNVFRHFRVDEWKRSSKEGDVAVVTVLAAGVLPALARSPSGHCDCPPALHRLQLLSLSRTRS